MAVAHSAASESHAATTGSVNQTSFNWTHTQTGTPQGVLVFVHVANSTGDPVSTVTYGSVTLTRVSGGAAIDGAGEAGRTDLFFAGSGLASGNQTITVNRANTADIMYASAATVTAATNTNVTGIVLLEGDGTMAEQSVNDGTPGTNSLRYAAAYSGLNAPPTTGANSTSLTSIDFGNYTAAMVRETTAGQGARSVGFTTASDDRAAVHVAVRELWDRSIAADRGDFRLPERNMFPYSDDFTQQTSEYWTVTNATLTTLAATAPDGSNTAALLLETTVNSEHRLNRRTTYRANKVYTLSGYFKTYAGAATRRVRLNLGSPTGGWAANTFVIADLGTGTITSSSGSPSSSSITAVGNGWYRVHVSKEYTGANVPDNTFYIEGVAQLISGTSTAIYTGVADAGMYVWGFQYEEGELSQYDPTYDYPSGLRNEPRVTDLKVGWIVAGEVQNFALTGQSATLTEFQPDTLSAETAAYALTGQPADTRHNVRIEAGTGGFTLAGRPATLAKAAAKVLTVDAGTFALAGNPASTLVAAQLGGDVGKFFLPERNLARYSEQFDNAYWIKYGIGSALAPVVTADHAVAPDGTLTAERIVFDTNGSTTVNDRSDLEAGGSTSSVIGKTYIFSVWLKTTDSSSITIQLSHAAASPTYPTVTGTWQRFTSLSNTAVDTNRRPRLSLRVGTPTSAYASLHVWGLQWEEGASITDYDPTGPAGATDAALLQQYKLTTEVGVFTYTGQPATLRHNPRIEANTGIFALAGGAPALLRGRYLSGGSGTFTETGQPATFRRTWAVQAATGAFTFTGNPAALTEQGAYEIDPAVGVFTLTGNPATLRDTDRLEPAVGIFTFSGNSVSLKKNFSLTGTRGAFTFTDQPAELKQGYRLSAEVGIFSLTGNPATLAKVSAEQLSAATGAFAFAGQSAQLARARTVETGRGVFALTGQTATFAVAGSPTLTADSGLFAITGNPIAFNLIDVYALEAAAGTFELTGSTTVLTYEQRRRVILIF